jgi:CheY-like chemotaxis protein
MTDHKPQPQILFVDDEPDFLRVVTETFTDLSEGRWRMYQANSADAALEILRQHKMDLVVVDINMPLLDGVQLLRIMNRRHPDLKKVTLTGFASEVKRNECLANGAELFIEKPRTAQGFKSIYLMLEELVTWTPKKGFQGMLRQVGLNDVIQMECLGRNSSILEIQNRRVRGRIYIEEGDIIHATCGDEQGEKAFQKLLSTAAGEFKLHPYEAPGIRTIEGSWEFLLMEAARVSDELASQAPAEPVPTEAEIPAAEPVVEELPDVVVAETLICLPKGEVVYAASCADTLARVALLQTISQQAGLLTQSLPLGKFERLEVLQPTNRVVAKISPDHMMFVRVASLIPPA